MIPGPDEADLRRRGQLPTFIPNYYRGAHRQYPSASGRSSQLVHTGTIHWIYRCLVDGLFGVTGDERGMRLAPQLPSDWSQATIKRRFRGATFNIRFERDALVPQMSAQMESVPLADNRIDDFEPGRSYDVLVRLPSAQR